MLAIIKFMILPNILLLLMNNMYYFVKEQSEQFCRKFKIKKFLNLGNNYKTQVSKYS